MMFEMRHRTLIEYQNTLNIPTLKLYIKYGVTFDFRRFWKSLMDDNLQNLICQHVYAKKLQKSKVFIGEFKYM